VQCDRRIRSGCFDFSDRRLNWWDDWGKRHEEGGAVQIGDKVRLIGIPPDAHDDDRELKTRTLFEKCLGETFVVVALETVGGLPYQLVQLDVGHMLGKDPCLETIWVEPEYLKVQEPQ
jgi:hypothetical protein